MFRRSGVMGAEKNVMGAVPVALTLQQLDNTFNGNLSGNVYSTSIELTTGGAAAPVCELDFVWMKLGRFPGKVEIIIGECKDRGRDDGETIDQVDMNCLRAVADALPHERFEAYILLAELNPFAPEEIAAARTLNGAYQRRVILLTADELEPWHIFDRLPEELKQNARGGTAENLANLTAARPFPEPPPNQPPPQA
jgi:hypothetical protein